MLSPDDYIEFDLIPVYLDKYYTDISDSFMDDINALFKRHTILAELKKNSRGLYYIESSTQLNNENSKFISSWATINLFK